MGQEGMRLLSEAVTAHCNALQVYIREHLPQQWAITQNNLDNALTSQGESTPGEEGVRLLAEAVTAYRNALQVYTSEQLPQQWATLPDDIPALSIFAETCFTTSRFAEFESRTVALRANPKVPSQIKAALHALDIANSLTLGQPERVVGKMNELRTLVSGQSADFTVGWSFDGTEHFIAQSEVLSPYRDWLQQLFRAMKAENRDAIAKAQQAAEASFKTAK